MGEMKLCPHCNAKMVEYKHHLNNGMVSALYQLYLSGGRKNLQKLDLTKNQYTNFYKLQYWSLAKSTKTNGEWEITETGKRFVEGKAVVQPYVWSYRGKALRFEGQVKYIFNFDIPNYRQRQDYLDDAVIH